MNDKDERAGNRFSLTLEGKDQDGDLRLVEFTAQLNQLQKVLAALDRDVSSGERTTDFRVVDLSHSSRASVSIEAICMPHRRDHRAALVRKFERTTSSILRGESAADVDVEILEEFRKFAAPVRQRIGSMSLRFGNDRLDITPNFVAKIEAALADVESCEGTVWGALDALNVHGDANVFYIYPEIGRDKVRCRFPEELFEKARQGVKRRVGVTGTMRFRPAACFPHEVSVREMEVFPAEADLPLLSELRGLAPDASDGLPSESFVRQQREDWN
jgi:hypothetical protein